MFFIVTISSCFRIASSNVSVLETPLTNEFHENFLPKSSHNLKQSAALTLLNVILTVIVYLDALNSIRSNVWVKLVNLNLADRSARAASSPRPTTMVHDRVWS